MSRRKEETKLRRRGAREAHYRQAKQADTQPERRPYAGGYGVQGLGFDGLEPPVRCHSAPHAFATARRWLELYLGPEARVVVLSAAETVVRTLARVFRRAAPEPKRRGRGRR